jgi:hypothetical protein
LSKPSRASRSPSFLPRNEKWLKPISAFSRGGWEGVQPDALVRGRPQIIDGRPAMGHAACVTPNCRRLVGLMPLDVGVNRMEVDAEVLWVEPGALFTVLLHECRVGPNVLDDCPSTSQGLVSASSAKLQGPSSPSSTTRPEPPRWGRSCSASHWRWSRRRGHSCSC